MHLLSVIILLTALISPALSFAEVQTFTATHTYILGDHDSKDDARQRCLLEAKRKILEQAGVYIESASEVKNFDLTKDKITSFAAAVMQVKDTKEEVSFQQGHMTMTLKLTAQVDLTEVRKQLAARQFDAGVREDMAAQKERLQYLEAQLEGMQKQQQVGQAPDRGPASPLSDIPSPNLQRLKAQADQGDAGAQVKLGYIYDFGQGVPQDYAAARGWYQKAAAQGIAAAQFKLGFLYAEGQGVPQDYAQAAKWYQKAAAQGEAIVQFSLGALYAEGKGVPQDYAQAAKWYEKAAAQGYANAQIYLGMAYYKGEGVPQDYAQAAKWFQKAAPQGHVAVQYTLGALYFMGKGVPQDYAKARLWYEKAAAQGNDMAQLKLGTLYEEGQGVPQDYAQAAKWYQKAAAQGNVNAQVSLGEAYSMGKGVPQDNVLSYMWYSLAVHGDPDSRQSTNESLEGLQKIMTPAQVAEAQKLAREWTPKK
jgi:TPR repeat protein